MAVKRRKSKRKTPIAEAERAWLVGDRENDGFCHSQNPVTMTTKRGYGAVTATMFALIGSLDGHDRLSVYGERCGLSTSRASKGVGFLSLKKSAVTKPTKALAEIKLAITVFDQMAVSAAVVIQSRCAPPNFLIGF